MEWTIWKVATTDVVNLDDLVIKIDFRANCPYGLSVGAPYNPYGNDDFNESCGLWLHHRYTIDLVTIPETKSVSLRRLNANILNFLIVLWNPRIFKDSSGILMYLLNFA